jgi:site-specific DNA-methyltransferase (adenine-specific)
MGTKWDAWVPPPELWREVLRVLKPGGHALVFAGSRTVDLMGMSLRLAGFEIRDQIQWLYGSGFPKSHDISKAIDKKLGKEREVIGERKATGNARKASNATGHSIKRPNIEGRDFIDTTIQYTRAASEEAQSAEGWGSALKPAHEPVILCRRPLDGTFADNWMEYGVGGLNIDATRIAAPGEKIENHGRSVDSPIYSPLGKIEKGQSPGMELGRWPANVVLDEEAGAMLDEQAPVTGQAASVSEKAGQRIGYNFRSTEAATRPKRDAPPRASRFFYCAKAAVKEKEAGLHHREQETVGDGRKKSIDNPYQRGKTQRRNVHPTVKPISLMRWLVKLITPENGVVLDPFLGSGTTAIAALLEGKRVVGFEMSEDFFQIALARIAHWHQEEQVLEEEEPVLEEEEPVLEETLEPQSKQGSLF